KSKGAKIEVIKKGSSGKYTAKSPLDEIKKIMSGFKAAAIKGLPRFSGGFVGYAGYDIVRFIEKLPDKNPDELGIEDAVFMLAGSQVIFDNSNHTVKIVVNAYIGTRGKRQGTRDKGQETRDKRQGVYEEAVRGIDRIIDVLNKPLDEKKKPAVKKRQAHKIKSNFTKREYENIVRKAKEYIRSGDIIQMVPSQRFRTKINCEAFDVYRSLRSVNPSPYMFYLNFGDVKLVGSSPELLVRCENGVVETRPIAGTRPRGRNEAEDDRLEKELLLDAKERAEHVMLVDLGRNDIGRVCVPGSVKVSEFMSVEKYSHVMHIVSNCRGRLAKGKDSYDVLAAAFPAGTVSGAPKIRAMEIIDELENTRRGPYAGAVGYFSFSGNMDTCINIRSILIKGKDAFIQAGGGVVADSVPSREYHETVNKAKAMVKAIELAERGLEK
ncbi:MAG: anthranilate synthase component I, partial [Candidatus Omnitrophica bacterium]|nr:anthranilate synthase component I [Candidatus Omnitrophota bacterium]